MRLSRHMALVLTLAFLTACSTSPVRIAWPDSCMEPQDVPDRYTTGATYRQRLIEAERVLAQAQRGERNMQCLRNFRREIDHG